MPWASIASATLPEPAAAATLGAVALHLATGVPMSLYSQFSVLLLVVVCSSLAVLADPRDGMAGRAFLPLTAGYAIIRITHHEAVFHASLSFWR